MTDSQEISVMLNDTHVLVVDPQDDLRDELAHQFEYLGATVHRAASQMAAVGMYYNLFRAQKCPRMVVSDWWLTPLGSPEHAFYRRVGRADRDGSCQLLALNATELDPTCLFVCYTDTPGIAEEKLAVYRTPLNTVEVVDRQHTTVIQLVSQTAIYRAISNQRITPEAVAQKLARGSTSSYYRAHRPKATV